MGFRSSYTEPESHICHIASSKIVVVAIYNNSVLKLVSYVYEACVATVFYAQAADGYVSTGQGILGNNMFSYCGNNPVMRFDPDGKSWIFIGLITASMLLLSGCSSHSEPVPKPEPPNLSVEPYSTYGEGRGNVYIVSEDKVAELQNNISDTDVIIVDYRTNSDPNMQIKQSFKISNKKYKKEIAQIMIDFNSENPVDPAWNRSINSIVDEWRFHNFAYSIGYKIERTADTDFNNNDEGKNFFDFLWR